MSRSVSGSVGSGESHGALLKGSDVVKAKRRSIGGVILRVREAPQGFGSPFIVDFDTEVLPGIASWPCNTTEARKLASLISDDIDEWEGYGIILAVTPANNPKTGRMVDSLTVYSVADPEKAKKERKSKPSIKKNATGKGGPAPFAPVEECPF